MPYTNGPWNLWVTGYTGETPSLWEIMDKTQNVIGEIQSRNIADARLMVSSPDLLAALREIAEMTNGATGGMHAEIYEIASAAVAKAKV